MIQKVITQLLRRQHYWRTVSFDELSELYTSMFLRSMALNIVGIFVPIYLYRLGYSITSLCAMYVVWFLVRPPLAYISAQAIARFGPKHTMALGVSSHIVFLAVLLSMESMRWPLAFVATVGSFAISSYAMAYEVDFSKVKHRDHGGKELGYVHMFTKVGAILGPLLGGLLATLTSPRYTIAIAIFAMLGSLIPIFMSAEPVKTKQHLRLSGFPWRRHTRDIQSSLFYSADNGASLVVWPLFLGVIIFTGADAFAAVGALTALGTGVALIAIRMIGILIDEQQGGLLLRVGVILNSLVHVSRVFVTVPMQTIPISMINEPITSMFQMPYAKGVYDAADSVPGYRIVYLAIMQVSQAIGLVIFWLIMTAMSLFLSTDMTLRLGFVVAAVQSLGIMLQRFPALRSYA